MNLNLGTVEFLMIVAILVFVMLIAFGVLPS